MVRTAPLVDLQPIDRLEEKVRQLVGMIDTLRAERAKAVDEAARLQRELDGARASACSEASGASAEVGDAARRARAHPQPRRPDDRADRQAESLSVATASRPHEHPRRPRRDSRPALRDPQRARPAVHRRARRLPRREDARSPRASWPAPTRCASPSSPRSTSPTSSSARAPTRRAPTAACARAPPRSSASSTPCSTRRTPSVVNAKPSVDDCRHLRSTLQLRRSDLSIWPIPAISIASCYDVLPALCVMVRSVA